MSTYKVTFLGEDGGDEEVFFLEIEASSRTQMMYNILNEEWNQAGYFNLNDDDIRNVFFNFLSMLSGGADWTDPDDADNDYYLYKLKEFSKLNLNIRDFLDKNLKEISEEDILDYFCSSINDLFNYETAGTENFYYEIEKA